MLITLLAPYHGTVRKPAATVIQQREHQVSNALRIVYDAD
jgi:hypothetical protein